MNATDVMNTDMTNTDRLNMTWPDADHDAWWATADRFAKGHATHGAWPAAPAKGDKALMGWLDSMHGLGWASLCAAPARGGHGQPLGVLCRVLEAVSAVHASAAATVYASAAAHMALNLSELPADRQRLLRDLVVDWLAWPAFHDIDEQLWPTVDAQGYLRGQVDMVLGGLHAQWAVLPAQLRDQGVAMVLVDLRHPAVIRGGAVSTLGLTGCGIGDVEFGGVPCEVLSTQGRALFAALTGKLAPAVLAMYCGLSRASLEVAMAYTAQRHQGGGPLTGWGEVRRLLSLMQERLRVQQGLLYAAVSSDTASAIMNARYAVLHAGKLACEQASDGVQLLGGAGYMNGSPQSVRLRDAHQLKCLMGGVAWRRQALIDEALKP